MLCKVLAGPISSIDGSIRNTGETIELSESDAQQLTTWGIIEIVNDKPPVTAPEPPPVPSAPVVPATSTEAASVPAKDVEVQKVQPEPVTTDTGSTAETKTKASAK